MLITQGEREKYDNYENIFSDDVAVTGLGNKKIR